MALSAALPSFAEIEDVLGPEDAKLFANVYGVTAEGNFEGCNILNRLGAIELRDAETGRLICKLEQADWKPLLQTGWRAPESFVAKGRDGKTNIYGIIIRPSNFDPKRTYPVIEQIYAGPQGAFVPKLFGLQTRQHAR